MAFCPHATCHKDTRAPVPGKASKRRGLTMLSQGFASSSAGKESTCNAGDPSLIAGSERSPGEGNDFPLQYSGLENSMDCKESNMTERLSLSLHVLAQPRHMEF